jgi:hypothetical protein
VTMEWEDVRLLPAELMLSMSGMAAMMLALGATIEGLPFAAPFAILAFLLMLAGGTLAPQRRWSLRLGSIVGWAAIPVWLASFFALDRPDDASTALFCLGMAISAAWASRFLSAELQPPEWLREYEPSDERPQVQVDGWIEELRDDAPLLVELPRRRLTTTGARTTSW